MRGTNLDTSLNLKDVKVRIFNKVFPVWLQRFSRNVKNIYVFYLK